MKKVIKGSVYNTETAREVGSVAPNGWDTGNFNYLSETLYCTKSGKYFLHGEGHANSRYGVWQGNTGGWGETIIPYSPNQAAEWAEANLSADEYMNEFGEVEEASDDKAPLSLTISTETKRTLEKMRAESGDSISKIVEGILTGYFDKP